MQKEIEERMKFLGRGWIVHVGGRKTKKGGALSYSTSNMANQLTINSLLDQWALSSMGKTSALFK